LKKKFKIYRKNEKAAKNPFDVFGPGVKAYFRLQYFLLAGFLIISLLFIPVMVSFYKGGAFNN